MDTQGVSIMLQTILREERKKHQDRPLNLLRAVDQPFEDHFICSICHGIVDAPKECSKCNNLFCLACINRWKEQSSNCPACRVRITDSMKVHRFVQKKILEVKFFCEMCNE